MKLSLLMYLCLSVTALAFPLAPDDGRTPGDYCTDENIDFVEYRYEEEIPYCVRNVAQARKATVYKEYKIPKQEQNHYTIDHLIPLALGGSNAKSNLWPEHKEIKALRPNLEMELFIALRDGKITQEDAVEKILEAKFFPCGRASPCDLSEPAFAQ